MLNEVMKSFLKPKVQKQQSSYVQPDKVMNDLSGDGIVNTAFFDTGNNNNIFVNTDGNDIAMKQKEKISRYRQVAMIPDVNDGIDEIVNEIIFNFNSELPIKINVDQDSEKIQESITQSFNKICNLLKLKKNFFNIVKQTYIDGQVRIHLSFDKNKKNGINSIKLIDPAMLIFDGKDNLYKYSENRTSYYNTSSDNLLSYSEEEIIKDDFGLYSDGLILSYLEYSIKPANMLRTLEDLLVPMRFSRSISRRVFNVDVGDLPGKRSEEILNEYQQKFKYKKFYNAETGEVSNMQHITSMVEDYWFTNRSGGKGTTVETIDETGNLGELNDIMYFYKKLYKSMKIPLSRISIDSDADHGFDYESTQTTKEDIKFFMHISRLRLVYISVIKELLKRELIYSEKFSEKDYSEIEEHINIYFVHNNSFIEKMELDNLTKKVEIFATLQEQAGKLMPVEDILQKLFNYSEKDIEDLMKKIKKEEENPLYAKFYPKEEE